MSHSLDHARRGARYWRKKWQQARKWNLSRAERSRRWRLYLRRLRQVRAHKSPEQKVVEWATSKIGQTENPPGSNRGKEISKWQRVFGADGVAWCGAFAGFALKRVGVRVNSRILYTPYILQDAKNGTNGFEGFYPWSQRKVGDLVLFKFGPGDPVQHVGIYVGRGLTVEGNTSSDNRGSQDNGGGVFRRKRNPAHIVGCARPRYPR